jgi:hypothetical protein
MRQQTKDTRSEQEYRSNCESHFPSHLDLLSAQQELYIRMFELRGRGINSYSLSNRRARRRKSKIAGAHFSMAAGITMVLRTVKSSLAVRMKTAM